MRAGNGYLTVTHRRPDKLTFLKAFGEQAQTISISPQDFNRVSPSATEDKQVVGQGKKLFRWRLSGLPEVMNVVS